MDTQDVSKLTSEDQATKYIKAWTLVSHGEINGSPTWAFNVTEVVSRWRTYQRINLDDTATQVEKQEAYSQYKDMEISLYAAELDMNDTPLLEQMRPGAISKVSQSASNALEKHREYRKAVDSGEIREERTAGTYEEAGRRLKNYFGITSVSDDIIPAPQLNTTDNISNCKPLADLMDIVTMKGKGNVVDIASEVSLPFDKYEEFNPGKLDHDFKMTIIHKDIEKMTNEIRKHADLMDNLSVLSDLRSIITIYGEKSAKDSLKKARAKVDDLHKNHGDVFSKEDVTKLKRALDKVISSDLTALIQSTYEISGKESWVAQEYRNVCVPASFTAALRAAGWNWSSRIPYINNWVEHSSNPYHAKRDAHMSGISDSYPGSFIMNVACRRGHLTKWVIKEMAENRKAGNPDISKRWEIESEKLGWMCSEDYSTSTTGNYAVTGNLYYRKPASDTALQKTVFKVGSDMPFKDSIYGFYYDYLTYEQLTTVISLGCPAIITIQRYHDKDFPGGVPVENASGAHSIAVVGVTTGNTGIIVHDSNTIMTRPDGSGTVKHADHFYRKLDGTSFKMGDKQHSVVISREHIIYAGSRGINYGNNRSARIEGTDGQYRIQTVVVIPKAKATAFKALLENPEAKKSGMKMALGNTKHMDDASNLYASTGVANDIKSIVSLMISHLS